MLAITFAIVTAVFTVVVVPAAAARAAVACRVDHTVASQWPGGFTGDVTVRNLGDPVNGWRLTWTFTAGQRISQAWNATATQSGTVVTAVDAGYNAAIPSGGSTTFGFNATGGGSAPADFALNGVPCTGAPASPTPTASPTAGPTPSPSPTPSGPTTPPASYPAPGHVTGNIGVHDPTVVKRPGGGYLMAHTGDNIALKTSTDRVDWRNAGSVFPGGAPWTAAYTGGALNLWAPDISYRNGQYYLYYSASSFGSNRSAIFLATSPTGASGSWTDRGTVISTTASSDHNAIDPNLIVDDQGRWWMSFGSFWSGIKLIELDPATGKRLNTTVRGIAARPGSTAIEAPTIVKHGGYYYQWVSFDRCCQGAASTYRVMVGRSTGVTGPYVDRNGVAMTSGGGTQVLAGHGSIHGPGHQAVLADTDGELLVYHYYADNGASRLGINRIGYDSAGWPFVH